MSETWARSVGVLDVSARCVHHGSWQLVTADTGEAIVPRRVRLGASLLGCVTILLGLVVVLPPASAVAASSAADAASSAICRSSSHAWVAARLSRDIQTALRGRVSAVAVGVEDPGQGLQCWLNASEHFDSASVVKVTILGALLRRAEDRHKYLTRTETAQATAMITRSDNDAASDLWADVGRRYLQHFLDLAGMTQTSLGPGGYWGLTQITARDEMRLLRLLLTKNTVLDAASRDYALGLMARVIPSQRWGVTAGAPRGLTVHVKNGWLPLATHGWRIHSIGCFTGHGGGYCIVVLTQDNPTMAYGIDTIQAIATAVNRDLNR
jgi:beta-lactamase class A